MFNYDYPKVYKFPYLYQRFSERSKENQNVKSLSKADDRPIVLFVPIIYGSPPGRSFQLNQPFPIEFVKWHKALAE